MEPFAAKTWILVSITFLNTLTLKVNEEEETTLRSRKSQLRFLVWFQEMMLKPKLKNYESKETENGREDDDDES